MKLHLILGSLLLSSIVVATNVFANQKPIVVATPEPPPFVVDSRLISLGAELGIREGELQECHATVGSTSVANSDIPNPSSVFVSNTQTIYIFPAMFDRPRANQLVVLAHEYMHCVWSRKTEAEKQALAGYLNRSYDQNADVRALLINYTNLRNDDKINELHSYLCTEVDDNRLGDKFLAYCSYYLPNRQALRNRI